jgi:hypothetical protein
VKWVAKRMLTGVGTAYLDLIFANGRAGMSGSVFEDILRCWNGTGVSSDRGATQPIMSFHFETNFNVHPSPVAPRFASYPAATG